LIQLSCLYSAADDSPSDQRMISLDEMRRNSEQLVDCTVRIEQMLMQLAAAE
jgi:hypothetical protein